MVIGFSAGSGYDIYARLLARYMSRYIPGKPTIVSQNMPGAGSLRAAQYVGSVAPKDGSVLGTMSRSLPVEPLIGDAQVRRPRLQLDRQHRQQQQRLRHLARHRRQDSAGRRMTKPFVLGGEGPGSDLDNFALIMKNMFGAKVKLVLGLSGRHRGQSGDRAARARRPLRLVLGLDQEHQAGLAARQEDQPAGGVPRWRRRRTWRPMCRLRSTRCRTRSSARCCACISPGQAFGRPFFAAQGIPEDRKAALRAAFDATMKDPEFVAEGGKAPPRGEPDEGRGDRAPAERGLWAAEGADRQGPCRDPEDAPTMAMSRSDRITAPPQRPGTPQRSRDARCPAAPWSGPCPR